MRPVVAIGIIYLSITVFVILFAIVGYQLWDKRYKAKQGSTAPEGFNETSEVMIDPTTGKKSTVYFNPKTGSRFYLEEK